LGGTPPIDLAKKCSFLAWKRTRAGISVFDGYTLEMDQKFFKPNDIKFVTFFGLYGKTLFL